MRFAFVSGTEVQGVLLSHGCGSSAVLFPVLISNTPITVSRFPQRHAVLICSGVYCFVVFILSFQPPIHFYTDRKLVTMAMEAFHGEYERLC